MGEETLVAMPLAPHVHLPPDPTAAKHRHDDDPADAREEKDAVSA
jgi:hypothetical protein